MRQRLPGSVRLEECALFGSIVSCEPLHCSKVLGLEEAREARKDETETIWIDAFCINRSDFVERASQILRQRSVHRVYDNLFIPCKLEY